MTAIGLLGDVMLGRLVGERIAGGAPPEERWSPELVELARSLDLVVANLECCLSTRGTPTERMPGKPFFFRGPPEAVQALTALGVRVAGLANNHALDFEDEALADTAEVLEAAGIAPVGAGTSEDARRPAIVEAGGERLAVVAVTEHPEEYAAEDAAWGTAYAPLHDGLPDWLREEIASAKRSADHVLAFPHWGPNMTTQLARWQRAAAQALLDAGADAVAGHSSHVFHGIAFEDDRPIAYDLGGALDDYRVDPKLRNDLGLLAIWRPGEPELEVVGLRLDFAFTTIASGADADWFARRLERACGALRSDVDRREEARFAISARRSPRRPGRPRRRSR